MGDKRKETQELLSKVPDDNLDTVKEAISKQIPAPKPVDESHLDPDNDYLELSEDKADRSHLVPVLAKLIAEANPPFTFSINGGWGSGKTIFMKWVEEEIGKSYSRSVFPIWFNAWQYESLGNLIYPLVKELESHARGVKLKRNIDLVLAGALVVGGGLITMPATTLIATISLAIQAWHANKKEKKDIETAYQSLSTLREELENYIASILEKNSDAERKLQKIVFFIDDLDRCSPDKSIELLESIKSFLWTNNCVFVFAIDHQIVSQAVKAKFVDGYDGESFLGKIIKYAFDLPVSTKGTVNQLLKTYQKAFPKAYKSTTITTFAGDLFEKANVRSVRLIKRVMYRYHFIIELLSQTNSTTDQLLDKDLIFVCCFLQQIYKDYFLYSVEHESIPSIDWISQLKNEQLTKDNPHTIGSPWYNVFEYGRRSSLREIINSFKSTRMVKGQNEAHQVNINIEYLKCAKFVYRYS